MPYATVETVRDAVAALQEQGVRPSIPKIRRHLGGGSHTTILRCLNEIREAPPAPDEDAASSDTGDLSAAISAELTAVDTALRKLEERIRQTLSREIADEQRRLRDAHQVEIDHLKASISDAWSRSAPRRPRVKPRMSATNWTVPRKTSKIYDTRPSKFVKSATS